MKLNSIIVVPAVAAIMIMSGQFAVPPTSIHPKGGETIGQRTFSLEKRYADRGVNEVMKDNILLSLAYVRGMQIDPQKVDWDKVNEPFEFEVILDPGRTFSFGPDVAMPYRGKIAYSTNAHFGFSDGFKSDGYLPGDGVCHVASLIYWAARDAGLATNTPVPHDFAKIPQVPAEYGVSIYSTPAEPSVGATQNLYVTNNREKPVIMKFAFDGDNLTVSFIEVK